MIILDTNVASELVKPTQDPAVVQWFQSRDRAELALTTVTVMELQHGMAKLPDGRRKRELKAFYRDFFSTAIAEIIPFDVPAAQETGTYMAMRARAGRPLTDVRDAMIAGILLGLVNRDGRSVTLATRNVKDFVDLNVVNPWDA